ncbi:hypothetical protein Esti_004908 [Eimeria stiedai]
MRQQQQQHLLQHELPAPLRPLRPSAHLGGVEGYNTINPSGSTCAVPVEAWDLAYPETQSGLLGGEAAAGMQPLVHQGHQQHRQRGSHLLKRCWTYITNSLRLLTSAVCRTLRLFAAVPQHRRLLQRGMASERGEGEGGGTDTLKGGALFFIPQKINNFVNKAERLQEWMMQGTVLPEPLRPRSIERSKTSQVRNWLNIHYCIDFPPTLFIYGRRLNLVDKDSSRKAADLLFTALLREAQQQHVDRQHKHIERHKAPPLEQQLLPQDDQQPQSSGSPAAAAAAGDRAEEEGDETPGVFDSVPSSRPRANNKTLYSEEGIDTFVATGEASSCLLVTTGQRSHQLNPTRNQQVARETQQDINLQDEHQEGTAGPGNTPALNHSDGNKQQQQQEEYEGGEAAPSLGIIRGMEGKGEISLSFPKTREKPGESAVFPSSPQQGPPPSLNVEGALWAAEGEGHLSTSFYFGDEGPADAARPRRQGRRSESEPPGRAAGEAPLPRTETDQSNAEKRGPQGGLLSLSGSSRLRRRLGGGSLLRLSGKGRGSEAAEGREGLLDDENKEEGSVCVAAASRGSRDRGAFDSFRNLSCKDSRDRTVSEEGGRGVKGEEKDKQTQRGGGASAEQAARGSQQQQKQQEAGGSSSDRAACCAASEEEEKGKKRKGEQREVHGEGQHEEQFLKKEILEQYLKPDEAEEFMKHADLAGHGKVDRIMFQRAVLNVYSLRKRLVRALKSQASIASTVLRMISLLLWFVTLIALLLVLGVEINTVVMSGAAFLSAITVSLSYIYQHFITAVIFVAFTNPYNIGDRIRVDGGDSLYVRRIRTYTTEFENMHGKPLIYSNASLFSRVITNESRAKNSTFELVISVSIFTPTPLLRALEQEMKRYVESRAMDFVKDSFRIIIYEVRPGHCIKARLNLLFLSSAADHKTPFLINSIFMGIWVTCVEGWGNWTKVLKQPVALIDSPSSFTPGINLHSYSESR